MSAKINASNYSPPNVNYWGDRCCKAEAKLKAIGEHSDTPELIRQYAKGMLDGVPQQSPSTEPK